MKSRIFILYAFLLISVHSFSQLAMGKWRTHFAYNAINQIAITDSKVFAISDGSLFSVEKNADCVQNDGCMEFYSKMNGLNDGNIIRIDYDKNTKKLIIIYKNGNIDLMGDGGIINIPDLYNKPMSISKVVNHIAFTQNRAYLSCNFGIVALNTAKNEIADTYFIGPQGSEVKVLNIAIWNNKIYALTPDKIYFANTNEPNLVNFEYWSSLNFIPGSGTLTKVDVFNSKLVVLRGDKLHIMDENNQWTEFLTDLNITDLFVTKDYLSLTTSDGKFITVNTLLERTTYENPGKIQDAEFESEQQRFWLAGNEKGIIALTKNPIEPAKTYKPQGPTVNSPWSMTFAGEKLYVVPGGRWAAQSMKKGDIMIFENEKWTNILADSIRKITNSEVLDFVNIAVDPTDPNHFFVTSYGTGLYEFREKTLVKWYNHENSTLETIVPGAALNYIRLDGITFDKDGNLYVVNTQVASSIKILLKNGTWTQQKYSDSNKPNIGNILINSQNPNHKWVNSYRLQPGILIFDDEGVHDNTNNYSKSVFLSSLNDTDNEGGKISPASVYCLTQDKNGVIWAGTEQGPLLFYNTTKAFTSDYTCSRVKIPRNDGTGYADYLLLSDKIKAIVIDGANRKWIGTEASGVYLMSENGQETIKHFTTSNSPLLSNDIMSISINPISGEVFFGTTNGLISYQSDAVDAGETFANVHAYPNPVRENFNGLVTITGLVSDTQVKITDLNGNLIYQTTSNGALATWDCKNSLGNKVSTGIYLVICANEDGTQSTITKIMVIN